MRGIGTVINVLTIAGGTLVGLIVGRYISERMRLTVEQAVGMTTLVLGIATAAKTDNIVFPLVSVVLGGIIGELLRVEERFETSQSGSENSNGLVVAQFTHNFAPAFC